MKGLPSLHVSPIEAACHCIPEHQVESFLQTKFWGLFKARTGWQAFSCSYFFEEENIRGHILVLRRRVAKIFTFLYVPFGATELEALPQRWEALAALGRAIGRALGGADIFIRFDLPWRASSAPDSTKRLSLHKGADIQVPDTVILDITKSEEELLAGMKPKWRYNIRLSQKKGISVKDEDLLGLPTFMELYRETAKRDKIAIHPESYYRTLFETASEVSSGAGPSLSLYVARHEGDALAGIIVLHMDGRATYLYGASSDKRRNLMPTYALQWHAITDAKKRGETTYDFFGIPPEEHDASHPMAGLFLFKTGFGGHIVHRCGAYDLEFHPIAYWVFRTGEQMRLFWHKKVKKNLGRLGRSVFKNCGPVPAPGDSSKNHDSEKTNPSNP
jgi:lipid II:glycine glycyltransferase (peptidoglycan interpeptide bridge formation enzyme)